MQKTVSKWLVGFSTSLKRKGNDIWDSSVPAQSYGLWPAAECMFCCQSLLNTTPPTYTSAQPEAVNKGRHKPATS